MSMNAGKPSSSQLLGALFRGDTDTLSRVLQDAVNERNRATQAAARHEVGPLGMDIEIPEGVRQAMREGRTVEAVHKMRQANPGLNLSSAKRIIDEQSRGPLPAAPGPGELKASVGKLRSGTALALAKAKRPPTVAPGDRGGTRAVIYALALAGGALAWWMLTGG